MRILISIIFLFISINTLFSYSKEDSVRIRNLMIQSSEALNEDIQSAKPIIEKGIKLCKQLNNQSSEARFYNILGVYYLHLSKLDSSEWAYDKTISLIFGKKDSILEAAIYNNIGLIKRRLGELDSSIFYYEKSKQIEQLRNNQVGKIECLMNISVVQEMKGEYARSISILHQCLTQLNTYGKDTLLELKARVYQSLGVVFFQLEDYEKSLGYFNSSYEVCQKNSDVLGQVRALDNSLRILLNQEKTQLIPTHLDTFRVLVNKLQYPYFLVALERKTADYYNLIHHYEEAFSHANKGIQQIKESEFDITSYGLNFSMGRALFGMKKYRQSLTYFLEALEESKAHKDIGFSVHVYRDIAQVYDKLETHQQAYNYLKKHQEVSDSLSSLTTKKIVQRLEVEYQTKILKQENEFKDQQIKLERAEKIAEKSKTQKAIWITIFSLLITIIMAFFWKKLQKVNAELREANLTIASKNRLLSKEIKEKEYYQNRFYKTQEKTIGVANTHSKREHINLGDILFIRKEKGTDAVNIHTKDRQVYTKSKGINELMNAELNNSFFAKVSKSEIINLHHLIEVTDENVIIETRNYDSNKQKVVSNQESFSLFKSGEIRESFFKVLESFQQKKS